MKKRFFFILLITGTSLAVGANTSLALDPGVPIYVISTNSAVSVTPFATSGDVIGNTILRGTPDGLGALKNSDGTLTLLSNHEISTSQNEAIAAKKADGTYSSSISKMTYDPKTNSVTALSPLIKSVSYYSYILDEFTDNWLLSFPVSTPYKDAYGAPLFTNGLSRFCSSTLAPAGTFSYSENVTTKVGKKSVTTKVDYGYDGAVYFTGEESGDWSRAFAVNMDGQMIQLPYLGLSSWENYVPAALRYNALLQLDHFLVNQSSHFHQQVGNAMTKVVPTAPKCRK